MSRPRMMKLYFNEPDSGTYPECVGVCAPNELRPTGTFTQREGWYLLPKRFDPLGKSLPEVLRVARKVMKRSIDRAPTPEARAAGKRFLERLEAP